jgi:hypothetical protein
VRSATRSSGSHDSLQWSRRLSAAEGSRAATWAGGTLTSFNGSAAFQRRRVLCPGDPGDPFADASMEPPPFSGGGSGHRVRVLGLHDGASMEPPPFSGGGSAPRLPRISSTCNAVCESPLREGSRRGTPRWLMQRLCQQDSSGISNTCRRCERPPGFSRHGTARNPVRRRPLYHIPPRP